MSKIVEERVKTIIEVLHAVSVLEWHDKNFLCSEDSARRMKREFTAELKNYYDSGYIKIV